MTTTILHRVQWPFVYEKLISIALVGVAIILLLPLDVQEAIIALGQGHFIACYYYQVKYHKVDRVYLIKYFTTLILLFGLYIYYPHFVLLVTVASVYFVIHLIVDESFLWHDQPRLQRGLAYLPLLLLYTGLIVDSTFVQEYGRVIEGQVMVAKVIPLLGRDIAPYCLMGAAVATLAYFGYLLLRRSRLEAHDVYFLLGALVLVILYMTDHVPNRYDLMGAIILFHYSNWYIHYFIRWGEDRPKRNRYVQTMVIINVIVLGLYAIYRWMPEALSVKYVPRFIFPYKSPTEGNILAYLFSPGYFYLWTLMHFISTARLSDLGNFRPRPPGL